MNIITIPKEKFIEIITDHKENSSCLDKLHEACFDICGTKIVEYGNKMFESVIESYFTPEGVDWIFWWLYELSFLSDDAPPATDEKGNPIPFDTVEDLWNFVKKYRKVMFCVPENFCVNLLNNSKVSNN